MRGLWHLLHALDVSHVSWQVFAESKDELALVLFGTDSTRNPLYCEGQYQNVTIHRHLMMPDFELLEEIENQIHPESQQADWILMLYVLLFFFFFLF